MKSQGTLFEVVNGNVTVANNFFTTSSNPLEAPSNGQSRTEGATVKLTSAEKERLQAFCFKHDLSVSEFMRNATNLYLTFFQHIDKILRYREAIISMVSKLP